ncbi:MAG: enoyl-CoA hydratase family protein [Nannocystis sp.]|uniref:enoyl-CoA hydratase family protein n=1 Tax=Nannocystis sp. TaxID=1962667 RepID=UPI002425B652|nr:enoyl-CoA hydratase family protein [Nannocystis sp.]MBK9752824.1 enoyl-CoA hydratase family protein [Nannocystis sp.]
MSTGHPPDLRPLELPRPRSFRYEERARVGVITLTRPDRFNALTFEVYRELTDLFMVVERRSHDPEGARALVLQGEGRAFCSGGDVDDIITRLFERDTEGLLRFTRMTGELIHAMRRCKLPIVASVKRVAAGAGAVMALASDLRVMGQGSFFSFLFPQVGLSGADMGASWLLPRVVGLGNASEILLLGDRVPADRCLQIGLANRVVVDEPDRDAVDRAAFELAARVAAGPHFANRMTKTMLQQELEMGFTDAIEAEAQAQTLCMQHPDFQEADRARQDKRAPRWR